MNNIDECGLTVYENSGWGVVHIIWDRHSKEVLGAIETVHQQNGWEVYRVAAKDGYGPWLYINAISTHENLCPNQEEGKVSQAASEVWQYFYDDGMESDELRDSPHEEEWLRRTYRNDHTIVNYETELAEAALASLNLSDEEETEIKQKAEELLDEAIDKVYHEL